MASTKRRRRRRLVLCFLGILLNALTGKCHYPNTGVESRPSAARFNSFVEDNRCRRAALGARCMLQAALLTSHPELGPAPVSVSISALNASVKTSAGAVSTVEFVLLSYRVIHGYLSILVCL